MKWILSTAIFVFGIAAFGGVEGNIALNSKVSDSEGRSITSLTNGDPSAKIGGEWGVYPKKGGIGWLLFDFGKLEKIGCVVLYWHTLFAKEYELQVSNDGKTFRTIRKNTEGKGRIEALGFPMTEARYLRILLKKPGTKYNGFYLYEVEVYEN